MLIVDDAQLCPSGNHDGRNDRILKAGSAKRATAKRVTATVTAIFADNRALSLKLHEHETLGDLAVELGDFGEPPLYVRVTFRELARAPRMP